MPRLHDFDSNDLLQRLEPHQRGSVLETLNERIRAWREEIREEALAANDELQILLDELDDLKIEIRDNDRWFETQGAENPDNGPTDLAARRERARLLWDKKQQLQDSLDSAQQLVTRAREVLEDLESREQAEYRLLLRGILLPFARRIENERVRETARQARQFREAEEKRLLREAEQRRLEEARNRRRLAKTRLQQICGQRHISSLYHFTPLDNLPGILEQGLVSRAAIQNINSSAILPDQERLDGWRDWISVSVGFPNYKLFVVYRTDRLVNEVQNWVILELDPSVIWECECRFLPSNAARSDRGFYDDGQWTEPAALEKLFAYPDMRQSVPSFYTTDPQAEVMIKDKIPKNLIRSVILEDAAAEHLLPNNHGLLIKREPSLFGPREDYEYWRKRRVPFS